MTALGTALDYLRRGYRPVALQPRAKGRTYVAWGVFRDRAPTEAELRTQFDDHPEAHLGLIVTDGLFRIDLDGGGAEQLLMAEGITLPDDAPRLKTGRAEGGCHVYLRAPESVQVPAFTGDNGLLKREDDEGKQVVEIRVNDIAPVPPTIHPSGRPYEWIEPLPAKPVEVPLAPPDLLKLIGKKAREEAATARRARPRSQSGSWLVDALRGADEGGRTEAGHRLCGYFFDRGMPREVVREILVGWADRCDPPMLLRDVDNVIRKRVWNVEDLEDDRSVIWHSEEMLDHVERRLRPKGDQWAAPTPLPSLNRALRGGFKSGRLYYIGGEPGVGKTAFVVQCLTATADEGLRALMVSAEMPREAIYDRELAALAEMDVGDIEDGRADAEVLRWAGSRLSSLQIAVASDGVRTVDDIRRAIEEVQPQLVMVDYLQLISHGERGSNTREKVEAVSKGLKLAAKSAECAVVCVSSLSRAKERKKGDEMPTNAQLRDSGALEFDADGILLFGKDKGTTKARMTKNRFGPTVTVAMRFHGAHMRFEELSDDTDGPPDDPNLFTEGGGDDVPDPGEF